MFKFTITLVIGATLTACATTQAGQETLEAKDEPLNTISDCNKFTSWERAMCRTAMANKPYTDCMKREQARNLPPKYAHQLCQDLKAN